MKPSMESCEWNARRLEHFAMVEGLLKDVCADTETVIDDDAGAEGTDVVDGGGVGER